MKYTILTFTLAAFTFAPTVCAEEVKYPPINPALLYWQAAAELPQLTAEQAKELRDVASGQLPFAAEKAADLLHQGGSLRLAEKAATSTAPCDWGLPMEDGPETALPHLSKMQEMASLAILKAESLFAQGQTTQGIQWLLTTHRMARHVGAGDVLVLFFVQNVIETNAIRAAARHCLAWDEETRHGYSAALKTLPPLHSVQDAFHGERALIDWLERNAKSESQMGQLMRKLTSEKPADKETVAAQIAPEALQVTLTEWRSLQSRLEAALGEPWAQSQPEIKALTDEAVHSPRYLIRNLTPGVSSIVEKGFILTTLHTMLDAALQHGPQLDATVAGRYRDALEGEPLRWQKAEDGTLTLLAARQHPAGKDLRLEFGK